MSTIYQCLRSDTRYIPPLERVVNEAATEREAIAWLEENGGGIYRNILHNFEFRVEPTTKEGRDEKAWLGGLKV